MSDHDLNDEHRRRCEAEDAHRDRIAELDTARGELERYRKLLDDPGELPLLVHPGHLEDLCKSIDKAKAVNVELDDEARMLRARCNVMSSGDEPWIWQADDNHLESMSDDMVVQITAGTLRDFARGLETMGDAVATAVRALEKLGPALEAVIAIAGEEDANGVSYSLAALEETAAASYGLRVDGVKLLAHTGDATLVDEKLADVGAPTLDRRTPGDVLGELENTIKPGIAAAIAEDLAVDPFEK